MSTDSNNMGNGEWLSPTDALLKSAPTGDLYGHNAKAVAEEVIRFGFRIGNIGLLLTACTVSEIVDEAAVSPMPATQPWFCGILNLRGNLVPIFDLYTLFGAERVIKEEPGRRKSVIQPRRLLILDKGEMSVGILIYELPKAIDTSNPLGQLPPLPPGLENHVGNTYEYEGEVWLDFNHPSFFEVIGKQVAI